MYTSSLNPLRRLNCRLLSASGSERWIVEMDENTECPWGVYSQYLCSTMYQDRKEIKYLISGATGATGGEAVILLLQNGLRVRAFAHREDERSRKLQELGAEVVFGDLQDLDDVSAALKGIQRAYFVYPISPGLVKAALIFAQAAKEAGVEAIVNMSQIQARREVKSNATREHWLAE